MKFRIRTLAAVALTAGLLAGGGAAVAASTPTVAQSSASSKPTIVLVHGAFADSSSWRHEIAALQKAGYPVVAVANPLRGVGSDAAYLTSVLRSIQGPIVLAGHSYAGFLISQAAAEVPAVSALVYVAAYIPMQGETPAALTYMYPGSLLADSNLVTRTEPGGTDIYVNPATFGEVYAGGLSERSIGIAAAVQRPIQASALSDAATVSPPATIPKWEIVALEDNAIPTQAQLFMAERAQATIVKTHSGHDVPQAKPEVVVNTILAAAQAVSKSNP